MCRSKRGADVAGVRRGETAGGSSRHDGGRRRPARAAVVATGIVANPYEPAIAAPRRGSAAACCTAWSTGGPMASPAQRVLVVGAGNSAGEIAAELARAGAHVTLAVRSGATIVPREIAGIPIQYLSLALGALPKSVQRLATRRSARVSALVHAAERCCRAPPRTACPTGAAHRAPSGRRASRGQRFA